MEGNWTSRQCTDFGSLAFPKGHCHLQSSLPFLKLCLFGASWAEELIGWAEEEPLICMPQFVSFCICTHNCAKILQRITWESNSSRTTVPTYEIHASTSLVGLTLTGYLLGLVEMFSLKQFFPLEKKKVSLKLECCTGMCLLLVSS